MSGSFPASFVPMIVMIEESASDRLLTASRTTAIELDAMPTAALKAASRTLASMPMMLVLMMTVSLLSSGVCAPDCFLLIFYSPCSIKCLY